MAFLTDNSQQQLFVLAGPNGAGKTTVARVLLPKTLGIRQFVNADSIAAGLSPFAPETTAIQAGKLMLQRIRGLLDNREDFGFESTLAGRGFAALIEEAKCSGYRVNVIYIWLSSPDLAVARVADRVRQGGHNVPEATIRRRYVRSLVNFFDLYRPLADLWIVCDNSGANAKIMARGVVEAGEFILDPVRFDRFKESVDHARQQR